MPTLNQKQIAEKLGISAATVSVVLRDPETNRASETTKQRIFEYAGSRRRSRPAPRDREATTVLFVMRGEERRFFFQQSMLHGAQERGAELGLKLEVINETQDFFSIGAARYVKGVLLESQDLGLSLPANLPASYRTITLNARYQGDIAGIGILADPYGGFRRAIKHLRELGHRRIAFLGYTDIAGYSDPRHRERELAFTEACRFTGTELTPEEVQLIPSNAGERFDRGQEIGDVLKRWREQADPPTAIICYNDLLAARVILIGLSMGIRVPHDVSLVGYDNEPLCQMLSPQLTSIHPRFDQMGRMAVSTLADDTLWTATEDPCRIIIPSRLVCRQSAGDVPVAR